MAVAAVVAAVAVAAAAAVTVAAAAAVTVAVAAGNYERIIVMIDFSI